MYHTIPIYTFNSVFYTFPAVTTLHRFSLKCNVLAREVWYPIAEMTQSVDFPVFSVQSMVCLSFRIVLIRMQASFFLLSRFNNKVEGIQASEVNSIQIF